MSKNQDRVFFLFGSGFSMPIGLPVCSGINEYFLRDNRLNILRASSGEIRWIDFASESLRNTRGYQHDWIRYGYLLNELVRIYRHNQNDQFKNYEHFFQFIADNIVDRKFLDELKNSAKTKFLSNHPNHVLDLKMKDHLFADIPSSQLIHVLNELIADLLFPRKAQYEYQKVYGRFIQYCQLLDQFDILSLNHDLVLEYLQDNLNFPKLNDGFSTKNSNLINDYNQPIKTFNGDFSEGNRFIKLHGSVDLYQLQHLDSQDGPLISTGENTYYKTTDYHEKQTPNRIDPKTGEILQSIQFDITPRFITGTNKESILKEDSMYQTLLSAGNKIIMEHSTLVVIGYSFGDEHVNQIIWKGLNSGNIQSVINVNPGMDFPYTDGNWSITDLDNINRLNHHLI